MFKLKSKLQFIEQKIKELLPTQIYVNFFRFESLKAQRHFQEHKKNANPSLNFYVSKSQLIITEILKLIQNLLIHCLLRPLMNGL